MRCTNGLRKACKTMIPQSKKYRRPSVPPSVEEAVLRVTLSNARKNHRRLRHPAPLDSKANLRDADMTRENQHPSCSSREQRMPTGSGQMSLENCGFATGSSQAGPGNKKRSNEPIRSTNYGVHLQSRVLKKKHINESSSPQAQTDQIVTELRASVAPRKRAQCSH